MSVPRPSGLAGGGSASATLALGLLIAAALVAPLPLYLTALALFGLPHVVWELGYLRRRYGQRWSHGWWGLLGAVLLVEAAVRAAVWLGRMQAQTAQIMDLLVLLLTGVVVLLAPRGMGWPTRIAGTLFACTVFLALQHGDFVPALLLLSAAHNFTPLALAWEWARRDASKRPLARQISFLFALPLLVACMPLQLLFSPIGLPPGTSVSAGLLDSQLMPHWGASLRQSWLSALVLAQCLHYYCVIRLLPQAQASDSQEVLLPIGLRRVALLASGLLTLYWLLDWASARALYAVASGVHAWLEWPVLLMAWTSAGVGVTGQPHLPAETGPA